MKKELIIITLQLLVGIAVIAQPYSTEQVDSLWQQFRNTENSDSVRFATITHLGVKVYRNQKADLDSAAYCFRLGIELAKASSSRRNLASAYNNLGNIFSYKSELDSATFYLSQSAELFKEIKEYGTAAGVLSNLSNIYGQKGDYVNTLDLLHEGLSLVEKENNTYAKMAILYKLALVNSDLGNQKSAIKYYLEIIELYGDDEEKDPNFSILARSLAVEYLNVNDYANARKYFMLSLENARKLQDPSTEQLAMVSLADLYLQMDSIAKAEQLYDAALKTNTLYDDLIYYQYYYGKCQIAKQRNEWGKALQYAKKAVEHANAMVDLGPRYLAYEEVYELNKRFGNTKEALYAHEQYQILRDSAVSLENKEAAIRFKYQIDYREKQVRDSLNYVQEKEMVEVRHEAKLERERYFKYLLFAALIILALGIFLLIQRYRHKQKQLDTTSKKLHHSTKDLEKVAEITKSKHELETDLVQDIRETLPLLENKSDQKRLVDVLRKRNWAVSDWVEENQFLQDIASGSSAFEEKLRVAYPELTKSEVELCRYLKAGYSTKKISSLRNISVEAVQKAKHRLRKKLHTEPGADLYDVMQQID